MEYVIKQPSGGMSPPQKTLLQLELGCTMSQYDLLMQRLQRIEDALIALTNKEAEKSAFIAETKVRLHSIEEELNSHTKEEKTQVSRAEDFRTETQKNVDGLRTLITKVSDDARIFPTEMENKRKGMAMLGSAILFVGSTIFTLITAITWLYQNLIKTQH